MARLRPLTQSQSQRFVVRILTEDLLSHNVFLSLGFERGDQLRRKARERGNGLKQRSTPAAKESKSARMTPVEPDRDIV